MATIAREDVGSSTGIATDTIRRMDKNPVADAESTTKPIENGRSPDELKGKKREALERKYKHVFAIHSKPKTSCLSHESVEAPSFLGFRNLMVLVLSELRIQEALW